MDIAIQEYGSPTGVWLVLLMNQSVLNTITDEPDPGTELTILELEDLPGNTGQSSQGAVPLVIPSSPVYIPVGGGGGGTPGEYVRLVGDDVIEGIKTFLTKIKVNQVQPVNEGQAININDVLIGDGEIDAGTF